MKKRAIVAQPVTAAIRAYAERTDRDPRTGSPYVRPGWPTSVLVLDTETTTDALQRLTFGTYRECQWADDATLVTTAEGLIYADDLPTRDPDGFALLRTYARSRKVEVNSDGPRKLHLVSASEFLNGIFFYRAFKARDLVVGFNLPFDLTRFATDWGQGRGKHYGAFSLRLWHRKETMTGEAKENPWMPRLSLKAVNSKLAFMQFVKAMETDPADGDVDDDGQAYVFGGNFLDLRTLVAALTGESHSLKSACELYKVEHEKVDAGEHGRITPEYIDYNRRDVLATTELLQALRPEVDRHPVVLNPCKLYSSASLSKTYLRALGVTPPAQQFSGLPREVFGIAMNAYYGGRAECHIRNTAVPVVYTDFLSMYPTVNARMDLWSLITAEDIVVEDCTAEVQALLAETTVEAVLNPEFWKRLGFFAEVQLDRDILPVRTAYAHGDRATNIGVNAVTSDIPLWYAGPDLVASVLLTGKAPKVQRAMRLVPRGRQAGLKPVRFLGGVEVDPATRDFFRAIIEERTRVKEDASLSEAERTAARQALKFLANTGSYGVFVEMNMEDLPKEETAPVRVYSQGASFETRVHRPEAAGEFFFAPVAVLITSGARLMLALLEVLVTQAGGTYAFCDTDSMAIVANRRGGLVPCNDGPYRMANGKPAVRALSWSVVENIVARVDALNPYDRAVVRDAILKIEDVNFEKDTKKQRQLFTYAISAKRYALFTRRGAKFQIVSAKEHGLGHLLNPYAKPEDGDWIKEVWQYIVGHALGGSPALPTFVTLPALSRITITAPGVLRPFAEAQRELPLAERIRPMNFLLSATLKDMGHPDGVEPGRFHLIRPYTRDVSAAMAEPWIDLYSGHEFHVTTDRLLDPFLAEVKSYGDVIAEYVTHPEPKSADVSGHPCDRRTRGLLYRRHIRITDVQLVGKETNRMEDVQNGLIHDWSEITNIYYDPAVDPWRTTILPQLTRFRLKELAEAGGVSTRAMRAIRNGHAMPSTNTRALIIEYLERMQR